MSERIHALAQHLLGKSSIEECSLEELQHLTKRYPFFAPAQFLLLQKLKATGSPEAASQQRKAVLYYHDPLQFDFFLSEQSNAEIETFAEEKILSSEREPDALLAAPHHQNEDVFVSEEQEIAESTALAPAVVERDEQPLSESLVFPEPDIVTETVIDDPRTELEILPVAPLPEDHSHFNRIREGLESVSPLPVETAHVIPEPQAKKESAAEIASATNHLPAVAPVEAAKSPASGEVLFEPYHTVDYFASQGIKVTAEDPGSKDKLSKQLRSFTEWLKIMKRLPATEIAQTPPSSAEITVEHMASHSVEGSDVVTEAMAEVWAKQGARQKAIETYNKLSLQNPSKKAYFAAKIENLKGS